jgi:hypothetical protein
MADADLQIKIGADASQLQAALSAVKGALDGLTAGLAGLKGAFAGLTASISDQAAAMGRLAAAMSATSTVASGSEGPLNGLGRAIDGVTAAGDRAEHLERLGGTVAVLARALGLLPPATSAATTGMVAFDAAAAANPVGDIVVAVAALGAAVVELAVWLKHLYDTNATVKAGFDALGAVFVGLGGILKGLWDLLGLGVDVAARLGQGLAGLIGLGIKPEIDKWRESWDAWRRIIDMDRRALALVVEVIGAFISSRFGPEIDVVAAAWSKVREALSDVAGVVMGAMKSAFDWLSAGLGDLVQLIGRLIGLRFPEIAIQWSKALSDLAAGFHDTASAAERLWRVLTNQAPAPLKPPPPPAPYGAGSDGNRHGGMPAAKAGACAQDAADCEAQVLQAKIEGDQKTLAADRDSHDAMEADFGRYLADVRAMYGEDSDQYRQALARKADFDRSYTASQAQSLAAQTAAAKAAGDKQVAEHERQQHELDAIDQASLKQVQKIWGSIVDPMVSKFTSGLVQMAEGAKSFAQVMRGIGQQLLDDFISKVIDPMIEKWLWKELGQSIATRVGVAERLAAEKTGQAQSVVVNGAATLKQITNSALAAAAGAYQAMATIPIIGPALGAAAAAATFAAVEGFGALVASAAGGYDIPTGVNPLVQAHAEEMILPASIARPLRGLIAGGGAGADDGRVPDAAGGAALHLHVSAIDGPNLLSHLRSNKDAYQTVMREIVRGGGAARMGLATV